MTATAPPIALTIAGSDSSGGAGIQADLKTFSALGVYGASVITALTAQNTQRVSAVHMVPPDFVRAQIDAVASDLDIAAIKIGMLASAAIIDAVDAGLAAFPARPIVLDPVMIATSGDRLIDENAVSSLREKLMPRAELITPNLPEAAYLTGEPIAEDDRAVEHQAALLVALGARAVLLKGGHGTGAEARDFYQEGAVRRWLSAPRSRTRNTHGTGCSLSSAIAAGLALGLPLSDAVDAAKRYITAAINASDRLKVGKGHGPVHHFHAVWPEV